MGIINIFTLLHTDKFIYKVTVICIAEYYHILNTKIINKSDDVQLR